MKTGVSIRCPHRDKTGLSFNHTSYDGPRSKATKRAKCALCGGVLVSTPTVWGAVEWRADGRYARPEITFTSPSAAQAAAVGEEVVRSFEVAS